MDANQSNQIHIYNLQPISQRSNVQQLPRDDNPTYLGITFDKKLTWKAQAEKAESRGKVRLALKQKLTSTD